MVEYLKKKRMYELAQNLSSEELPKCKDFHYTFYRGVEWLKCFPFAICSQSGGRWISIRQEVFDDSKKGMHIEEDIFARPVKGIYQFRSHNGKVVILDKIKKFGGSEL